MSTPRSGVSGPCSALSRQTSIATARASSALPGLTTATCDWEASSSESASISTHLLISGRWSRSHDRRRRCTSRSCLFAMSHAASSLSRLVVLSPMLIGWRSPPWQDESVQTTIQCAIHRSTGRAPAGSVARPSPPRCQTGAKPGRPRSCPRSPRGSGRRLGSVTIRPSLTSGPRCGVPRRRR